jgi:threonine dehydrogenase-like Zn-dependent dehydrogenase
VTKYILSRVTKSAFYRFFPPTKLDDIPEPEIKSGCVKIKTLLAGICGSDLGTILLQESPLLEPLCSFPAVMGHENVGHVVEIDEGVTGPEINDRVVVDPILSCTPRGIEPICKYCEEGNTASCENFDIGDLSPGMETGWCRDRGGSFSPYIIAHASQVHKVPDNVSNENAVLVEPFSIGIHVVSRHFPRDSDTVIVLGVGVIGLMIVTVLRTLGSKARIIAIDKSEFQGKMALKQGANDFIPARKDYYKELAKLLGLRLHTPLLPLIGKKKLVMGGVDVVYECAGKQDTVDDALRLTRAGGLMVLVGTPAQIKIDWSSVWFKELQVLGSFGSSMEEYNCVSKRHAFDIALDLMSSGKVDLSWMITHEFRFPKDYKKAIKYTINKGKYGVTKAIFTFDEEK